MVWAKVKEWGKQKWRVGDLLVDERCSPAVLDFLRSTHVGRTAPPVEENWDSEEEAEVEEMGDREEQAEYDPRSWYWVLFCVFSFCLFKMCTFLGAGFSCFHTFYLLGALTAQFVGGGAIIEPDLQARTADKIVCRHNLARLVNKNKKMSVDTDSGIYLSSNGPNPAGELHHRMPLLHRPTHQRSTGEVV